MSEIVTSVLNKNSLLYGSERIVMKNIGPLCVDMKGEEATCKEVTPVEAPIKAVREK